MPGKIPDRWEAYTPLGKPVPQTRFISFKVPLEAQMTRTLSPDEQFTPAMLVADVKKQGFELGMVIDLTNTKRYYNSREFTSVGLEYAKIFTEGHVVPSKKVRKKFFKTVENFLKKNSNNDLLVGVHCTHGLNRTGYMVCRYMIDKMDFQPENAIEAFNEARGYAMERENYLEDLKNGKRTEEVTSESEDEQGDKPNSWSSRDFHSKEHMRAPRQTQYSRNTGESNYGSRQYVPRGRPNGHQRNHGWGPSHPNSGPGPGPQRHYQRSGSWNKDDHQSYNGSSSSSHDRPSHMGENGYSRPSTYHGNYNSQQEYGAAHFNQGGYGRGNSSQYGPNSYYNSCGYSHSGRGRGGHSGGYQNPGYQGNQNGYGSYPSYGSGQSQGYGQFGHTHNR